MKLYKIILLAFLAILSSCGCRDDNTENYTLNSFENQIIPENARQVTFVNQNGEIISANYSQRVDETKDIDSSNDEECYATYVQKQNSILSLGEDVQFLLTIGKNRRNGTLFYLYNGSSSYGVQNCDSEIILENQLQFITIQGFTYQNVFVLNNCGEGSPISTIIYSLENAIEFIAFSDGTYLKLTV